MGVMIFSVDDSFKMRRPFQGTPFPGDCPRSVDSVLPRMDRIHSFLILPSRSCPVKPVIPEAPPSFSKSASGTRVFSGSFSFTVIEGGSPVTVDGCRGL